MDLTLWNPFPSSRNLLIFFDEWSRAQQIPRRETVSLFSDHIAFELSNLKISVVINSTKWVNAQWKLVVVRTDLSVSTNNFYSNSLIVPPPLLGGRTFSTKLWNEEFLCGGFVTHLNGPSIAEVHPSKKIPIGRRDEIRFHLQALPDPSDAGGTYTNTGTFYFSYVLQFTVSDR